MQAPAFFDPPLRMPGATLTTRLKVYEPGGTPHFHLLCTEMYFVIGGSGSVEIIDGNGVSEVELALHDAYVFSPGTLHRLSNPHGDLELFIYMQNSGLPERGDNVVTFRRETMNDPEAYCRAMAISSPADALRRRDGGVEGFLEVKAAFARSPEAGRAALDELYRATARATRALRPEWRQIVTDGALAEAEISLARAEALDRGEVDYLFQSKQHLIRPQPYSKAGYCGMLNRYFDPATLLPEGQVQK